MTTEDRALTAKIRRIKNALLKLSDFRPGTLSEQYNVCGKPDCRCKATPPKKHGPYFQLSFTWKGKSKTQFVRRENLATVKKQIRNYQRFRDLIDQWTELEFQLSQLKSQQARDAKGG